MSFSESVKIEVKRKAHYKCCICELSKPLEVHHIVPENQDGQDIVENAAPLCADCHDIYGGNPENGYEKKEISGMRNVKRHFLMRILVNLRKHKKL